LYLYYIRGCDIEVFLKNSQDTFIKKLFICSIYNQENILLPSIKKISFKKRRLSIWLLMFFSSINDKELFSLKDETKEFKLNDVIVQSYHSLVIGSLLIV
jgi:hypothetical protein